MGKFRPCAITSASERCAELGRLASDGEPAFPRCGEAIEANRPAQDLSAAPSRIRASTKVPAAERLDCLLPPSSNNRKVEKSTFSIEHYPRCDIFPGNK